MKRLGLYVIATCMLVGFFGGFSYPIHLFAQTTGLVHANGTPCGAGNTGYYMDDVCKDEQAVKPLDSEDINEIKGRATKVMDDNLSSIVPVFQKRDFRVTLDEIASAEFAKNPKPSYDEAATNIYQKFSDYLAQQASKVTVGGSISSGDEIRKVAAQMIDLRRTYENLNKLHTGQITADQANTNINNAIRGTATLKDKTLSGNEITGACAVRTLGIPTNLVGCFGDMLTWFIKSFILNIVGFFLWVAANMLNYSIQVGILDFKSWAPDALYSLWVIVRQIISLFIVFAGLYLGFMYILGKEEVFEKYMAWIIIYALFVNFSYPITRMLVDVSNIVSLNIYASAVGNDALTAEFTSMRTAGGIIMTSLGLQNLITAAVSGGNASSATDMLSNINTVPGALMAVIFVGYATYIFFMVTALIVLRTVALVSITIVSPLLLVDSVIPKLGEWAAKVRGVFFEQLAVGPVFMILLALTLKFLEVFRGVVNASPGGVAGGGQTIKEFFSVALMLIMLHVMYKVTKSTAGSMGEIATKAMGTVGGFAMGGAAGLAMGGAGMLGRASIGRVAARARDSGWMQNNQHTFIGRGLRNMTDSVANSSFDGRNSGIIKSGTTKLGMGIGMGSKLGRVGVDGGGYEKRLEAQKKDILERGARIDIYHKEDKYEKGLDGNQILVAKAGEVDQKALAARTRYYEKAGGAVFMAKDDKRKVQEALKDQSKTLGGKDQAEVAKLAEEDIKSFDKIQDIYGDNGKIVSTKQEQQVKRISDLEGELMEQKRRDPVGAESKQTQYLKEAINAIKIKQIANKTTEYDKIKGSEMVNGVIVSEKERKEKFLEELAGDLQILERNGDSQTRFENVPRVDEVKKVIESIVKKQEEDLKSLEQGVTNLMNRFSKLSNDQDRDRFRSNLPDNNISDEFERRLDSSKGSSQNTGVPNSSQTPSDNAPVFTGSSSTRNTSSPIIGGTIPQQPGYTTNQGGVIDVPINMKPSSRTSSPSVPSTPIDFDIGDASTPSTSTTQNTTGGTIPVTPTTHANQVDEEFADIF